jgi:hypothetical protein
MNDPPKNKHNIQHIEIPYVGAPARSLLWLPPTNVVNKCWSLGARSGNIIEEKRVPIQETVTCVKM